MDEDVSQEQPSSWDQGADQGTAGAGTYTEEPQPIDPYQDPATAGSYGQEAEPGYPPQDPAGAGTYGQEGEPSYPSQDLSGAGTYAEPQPVDPYATGSPAEAELVVGLGELILHQEATQGTTYLLVTVPVINWNSRPTTDGELILSIVASPYNVDTGDDRGSAERNANVLEPVPALASGQTHHIQVPLQLDAGSYHVTAEVSFADRGSALHSSAGDVTVHGGHASHAIAYDEIAQFDISVQVTGVTRLRESLYQVHYTLTNTSSHAVPAGLTVYGSLESAATGMFSQQTYQLPAKLEPHHPASSYLTLEGADTGWLTATIETDPNGPSHKSGMLQVEAENVQAHASTSTAAPHASHTAPHAAAAAPASPPGPMEQILDPEQAEFEWKTFITDGSKSVLEIASFFSKSEEFIGFVDGVVSPIGDAYMLYELFSTMIEAFGEEQKGWKRHGFIYGLVWEVMNRPTVAPQLGPINPYSMHSFEEESQAFLEGVRDGRERAMSDVTSHNALAGRIAYKMVKEKKDEHSAGEEVLNELGRAAGIGYQLDLDAPDVR